MGPGLPRSAVVLLAAPYNVLGPVNNTQKMKSRHNPTGRTSHIWVEMKSLGKSERFSNKVLALSSPVNLILNGGQSAD